MQNGWFCLHSKFPIFPKIPCLFTKVPGFIPSFQKLWVFCNSIAIQKDENCLLRAVLYCTYNTKDSHSSIRLSTINITISVVCKFYLFILYLFTVIYFVLRILYINCFVFCFVLLTSSIPVLRTGRD